MKKLLVLALAAMMAFGVTAMVGAKMPDQEQIPVYVKVNPFAQLITDDESLYITLEEPTEGISTLYESSDYVTFTIKTNTRVNVLITEDIVEKANLIGLGTEDIWSSGQDDTDWVIAPNLVVRKSGTQWNSGINGRIIPLELSLGSHTYDLRLDARWNLSHPDWWKIPATNGFVNVGNVIITVSADN